MNKRMVVRIVKASENRSSSAYGWLPGKYHVKLLHLYYVPDYGFIFQTPIVLTHPGHYLCIK